MKPIVAPWIVVASLLAGLTGAAADSGSFDMTTEHPSRPAAAPLEAIPPPTTKATPAEAVNSIGLAGAAQRPILPYETLRLSGEVDSRSWNLDLTKGESDSAATLTIGYKSAVVVAPESSRLRVLVNNRLALESPIAASENTGQLSIKLPPGLLHTGPNLFRVEVSQRHRTDCSIASTYELWTEIYNRDSALRFDAPLASMLHRLEDLSAVGVDPRG